MALPRIAIVGRPNVGKSTLLNRLARARVAITDPTPGVTRDAVEAKGTAGDYEVIYVDTGGYSESTEGFDPIVRERSLSEAERADIVLLIFDVTGLTAADEDVVAQMRRYSEKVVLLVNKVDSVKREMLMSEFFGLGFGDPVAISAAHGLGMEDLEERLVERLHSVDLGADPMASEESATTTTADTGQAGTDETGVEADTGRGSPVRIAILGKPNTGKSTLANRLLGEDRSLVSDIAGTTRDTVRASFVYNNTAFELLDTAGMRRKRSVSDAVEYYSVNRAVQAAEECDVALLVVDAADNLAEQDKKIAQVIVRRGKSIIIVLNKWDLLADVPNQLQAIEDRVAFVFPILAFAPIVPVSATTGFGVRKLVNMLTQVYGQSTRRIDTGVLNRKLGTWVERTPPPVVAGGRVKFQYMTQVGTQPATFVVFVNRSHGIPEQYTRYLTNCIRSELGFSHVPIRLELRSRRRA